MPGRDPGETWVHPVTVGAEPASRALAVWRFRLVLVVLLLIVTVAAFELFAKLKGGTDSPASGLRAPVTRSLEHL